MAKKENNTVELQLITVELGNGQKGIFVGTPLVISEMVHSRDEITVFGSLIFKTFQRTSLLNN